AACWPARSRIWKRTWPTPPTARRATARRSDSHSCAACRRHSGISAFPIVLIQHSPGPILRDALAFARAPQDEGGEKPLPAAAGAAMLGPPPESPGGLAFMKRKIAAIFAADVFGYSRMIAEDEEDTLQCLASYREVMDD